MCSYSLPSWTGNAGASGRKSAARWHRSTSQATSRKRGKSQILSCALENSWLLEKWKKTWLPSDDPKSFTSFSELWVLKGRSRESPTHLAWLEMRPRQDHPNQMELNTLNIWVETALPPLGAVDVLLTYCLPAESSEGTAVMVESQVLISVCLLTWHLSPVPRMAGEMEHGL